MAPLEASDAGGVLWLLCMLWSGTPQDHTAGWFRNLGGGAFGNLQTITRNAISAQGVSVADLDNDGDLDVISASSGDNTIAWYQNLGSGIFCILSR